MILTRIRRGAIRTNLLAQAKAHQAFASLARYAAPRVQPKRVMRSAALTALAVQTVMLPIPLTAPSSTVLASGDDSDPLPNAYKVGTHVAEALYFNDAALEAVSIEPTTLTEVHIGKSLATEQAEQLELQRQQQLELEKKAAAEKERQRQAELERQRQEAARLAAAKAAEQQASQVQAQATPAPAPSAGSVEEICRQITIQAFGEAEWTAMRTLINRESHFNVYASNASSGAYGIPQALPGSKMASAGADWRTNPATQMTWMIGYVRGRYGTPSRALAHSYSFGWY